MTTSLNQPVPTLSDLPVTLPREGAIEIELEQGVLVFRVSEVVQNRIEALLDKHRASSLTPDEEQELGQYEDLDDYLSYLNRLTRNQAEARKEAKKARETTGIASLTDIQRKEIFASWREGKTLVQIAERLSLPVSIVARLLKSLNREILEAARPESTSTDSSSESLLFEDETPR